MNPLLIVDNILCVQFIYFIPTHGEARLLSGQTFLS